MNKITSYIIIGFLIVAMGILSSCSFSKCDFCNGTGETWCTKCNGMGERVLDEVCQECKGEGQFEIILDGKKTIMPCTTCYGRGHAIGTCTYCAGTGRIRCPMCHGEGHN